MCMRMRACARVCACACVGLFMCVFGLVLVPAGAPVCRLNWCSVWGSFQSSDDSGNE